MSPFSRPVAAAEIAADGATLDLSADEHERAGLADLLDVPAINRLDAKLHLRQWSRGGMEVSGTLSAEVVRICVVTLDQFPQQVGAEIAARFAPPADAETPRRRADEEDNPEPGNAADLDAPDELVDGRAYLGALVAEFLALALDPYPRKPGVAFDAPAAPESAGNRPFAGLDRLLKAKNPPEG